MNASELADKLEDWRERVCDSQDIDDDKLSMSGFANIAFNYHREIIKSLRFAADMERLWRECPNNVTVYHGGLQDTPAWITAGLFREKDSLAYVESGFHADIYAAARKAVEKLEGKSP